MVEIVPIARVANARTALTDDGWGPVTSTIRLADGMPDEALDGIETFSHAEVLFVFDRVREADVVRGARHPRGNQAWPRVGILAQRGKDRPNRLGSTMVEIVRREGRDLVVRGLDAVDGTPVVDIKPVMREFLPRTPVLQPGWASEVMKEYW